MGSGVKGNKAGSGRFSCESQGRAELEAECGGTELALLLFIVLLALVDEGFAACEHLIHHAGELVRDRSVGPSPLNFIEEVW